MRAKGHIAPTAAPAVFTPPCTRSYPGACSYPLCSLHACSHLFVLSLVFIWTPHAPLVPCFCHWCCHLGGLHLCLHSSALVCTHQPSLSPASWFLYTPPLVCIHPVLVLSCLWYSTCDNMVSILRVDLYLPLYLGLKIPVKQNSY